jgi:phosphatidylglycerophosphatase A
VRKAVLSLFGVGLLPGPSGTWASLVTAGTLAAAHAGTPSPSSLVNLAVLAFGVVATLALAGSVSGGDGHGDPGWVVTDEVAGQALALGIAGASGRGDAWIAAVAAFVAFRVLDVAKPGPVGAAERLPGGLGVLADDLVAGALAGGAVVALRAAGAFGG